MKNLFNSKWVVVLVFFLISVTASIAWTPKEGIVHGTDSIYSLHWSETCTNKYIYSWEDHKTLGSYTTSQNRIFFGMIDCGIRDSNTTFLIVTTFLLFSSLFWTYLLISALTKNCKTLHVLSASLLYVFGPFQYYYVWQDQTGFQWFLPFLPAFLFCLYKILYEDKSKYRFLIFAISVLYGVGLSHIFLVVTFICSFFFVLPLCRQSANLKKILKEVFVIACLYAWLLVPYVFTVNTYLAASTKDKNQATDLYTNSRHSSLINTVSFTAYKTLYSSYIDNVSPVNSESSYYLSKWFIFLSIILFIFIATTSFWLGKDNSLNSYIFFVFLVLVFISSSAFLREKGLLIAHFPALAGFRNSFNKFAFPLGLAFVLLLTNSFQILQKRLKHLHWRKIANAAAALLIIIYTLPFLLSSPIFRGSGVLHSYYVDVPGDYSAIGSSEKGSLGQAAISLVLPIQYYGVGYFNWLRKDNDIPLSYFIQGATVSLRTGDSRTSSLVESINSSIKHHDYDSFQKTLQDYGINSVIFDNNQNWELWDKSYLTNQIVPLHSDYKNLADFLKTKFSNTSNGNISAFSISDKQNLIRLFDDEGNERQDFTFQKLSPVHYRVSLNLSVDSVLNLNQSYNKGWKVLINNQSIFKQLRGPISNNEEFQGFSNSWRFFPVNTVPYPLVVDLYFFPQLYFYLGLLISTFTVLVFLILFIRNKSIHS